MVITVATRSERPATGGLFASHDGLRKKASRAAWIV